MSPPSLVDPRFWQKRRAHYLAVFERALMLLREQGPLPEDEPGLNRELRFVVVTARREIDPAGRFDRPVFEAHNPPDPDAETTLPHEYKRPDAQWYFDDPDASDDRHREKSFVVECKRLGRPTNARWNLNERYVIGGIQRFRSLEHRYGMHMAEGVMIGYVQNMGLPAVHAEVCQHATAKDTPPPLLPTRGWQPRSVTYLTHQFDRGFPVSPFRLTHLWVDIQDIPTRPRTTATRNAPRRAKRSCSPRKRSGVAPQPRSRK